MRTALKRTIRKTVPHTRNLLPQNRLGDRIYGFLLFVASHGRLPNKSMTFNDVLYRIKNTDEIIDPLRVFITDKEFVKFYVKAVIGDQYNVPTIDIIRDRAKIEDYEFPAACCIKPTHLSGEIIIRKDIEPVDRGRIDSWFDVSHYALIREANYKTLKPKVIIEPIIFRGNDLIDYKIFCFKGKPKIIRVVEDYLGEDRRGLFDVNWNEFPFSLGVESYSVPSKKPGNLLELLDIAAKLSAGFNFIRVDLYSDGSRCLAGEMTNCHMSATQGFIPASAEKIASKILFGL
jgi:hypothetical protein